MSEGVLPSRAAWSRVSNAVKTVERLPADLTTGRGRGLLPQYGAGDSAIAFIFDGLGSVIQAGLLGDVRIQSAGRIVKATILSEPTGGGSFQVDILKAAYADFPTFASICGSAYPTLSSAQKSEDTTLTGWTTALAAGDCLRFSVRGTPSGVKWAIVELGVVAA